MARQGGNALYVYGVCQNTDMDGNGNPCPKCASKEQIKLNAHKDFVCPECGEPLKKITKTDSNWKLIAGICATAAIVGGGAYFALSGGDPDITSISLNKQTNELIVGSADTLKATLTPETATATLRWASNNEEVVKVVDGVVTAVAPGTAKVGVQVTDQKELKAFCDYTVKKADDTTVIPDDPKNTGKAKDEVKTPPASGKKIDLGFATYEGDTQGGKPHGNGTMTFKQAAVIPGSKGDIQAQPGDYVTGIWRNGEVNSVRLFQKGKDPQFIVHK